MKKSILEIYSLAVCFVTVICAVVTIGIGAYDLLEISNPEFTLPAYQYERHQSNEAFYRSDCEKKEEGKSLSEEERTKRRLASYEVALKAERRDAVQSLIKVFIVLVLNAAVFFGHWHLARRARETIAT
jgi:hypothetical protein